VDGYLRGLLDNAQMEYNPDVYMDQLLNIPFMTRIGGNDDSVNPWHARRMVRIYNQIHGDPHASFISEIPGAGHWFDNVVAGDIM
jgi:hypothetical protein